MTVLINPGSTIATAAEGWTNTYETARVEAERWLANMRNDDNLADVELLEPDGIEREGRWTFCFQHTVTGVVVELETHGIDDLEAYKRQNIFTPRVYWNGSSTSSPDIDQFAAPGFVVTYRAAG